MTCGVLEVKESAVPMRFARIEQKCLEPKGIIDTMVASIARSELLKTITNILQLLLGEFVIWCSILNCFKGLNRIGVPKNNWMNGTPKLHPSSD